MDKVELGIKIEQIGKLKAGRQYEKAAEIADTIEWRKVKKWSELMIGEEVYEKADRIKDARNICVYAYNRNLGGRSLVYKLTELLISLNDLDEANELYNEFIEMAPHDMSRYVLLFKLNRARGVSNERLIEILEEYKENELDEHYGYELADLYAKEERIDECIKECDDLFLWFNEGEYVEKALELKSRYTELTKAQSDKLDAMRELRNTNADKIYPDMPLDVQTSTSAGMNADAILNNPQKGSDRKSDIWEINPDEIVIPEKDYTIYDTQNIQEMLAKSMEGILSEINNGNKEDTEFKGDYSAGVSLSDDEAAEAEEAPQYEAAEAEETPQYEAADEEEIPQYEAAETEETPQYEAADEEEIPQYEAAEAEETPQYEAAVTEEESPDEAVVTEEDGFPENDDYKEPQDNINFRHNDQIYKMLLEEEMSATTEPINVEVIEIQASEEDDVDEPTREILINTHRWNKIKSVMEETDIQDNIPEYTDNYNEDVNDEDVVPDKKDEPLNSDIPEENVCVTEQNDEAASEYGSPVSNPVQLELDLEENDQQVIEGQLDLFYYLEHMDDKTDDAEDTNTHTEGNIADDIVEGLFDTDNYIDTSIIREAVLEALGESTDKENRENTGSTANSGAKAEPVVQGELKESTPQEEPEQPEEPALQEEPEQPEESAPQEEPEQPEESAPQEEPEQPEESALQEEPEQPEESAPQEEPEQPEEPALQEEPEQQNKDQQEPDKNGDYETNQECVEDEVPGSNADEDLDDNEELSSNVKKYVKKYLFMNGMEASIIHLIKGKKTEICDGTSCHGNIVIMGKKDTDKTNFAINIFKALHADDEQRELKIAKTTAEVLNKNGVISSTSKIRGTTLIIENADRLRKDILDELNAFMETDTGSMLVIFTGEEFMLKKKFMSFSGLRRKFDYILELKHYSVNELVEIAKEYARVRGYSIDEGALSTLYYKFDDIDGDDEGSEIEKVKKIVDAAIIKNGKSSRNFFGIKRSGLITLKEKHFSK